MTQKYILLWGHLAIWLTKTQNNHFSLIEVLRDICDNKIGQGAKEWSTNPQDKFWPLVLQINAVFDRFLFDNDSWNCVAIGNNLI